MPAGTFRYVGIEHGPGTAADPQGSSYSYVTDEQNFISLAGSSLFYHGFEGTSMRQLTSKASVNLAAVNIPGAGASPYIVASVVDVQHGGAAWNGDLVLLKGIIDLGHALELNLVAEGIETPEQHTIVRQLGCQQAQGFYFGRPSHPAQRDLDAAPPN